MATQKTKFKQTEIGLIPEEWEVKKAQDFCERVTDGTHESPKKKQKGKFLITSRHLKQNKLDFENAYFISQEDFEEINRRSKVDQFDVLFSMIGTVGETYQEKSNNINYAIKNVGLFKFGGDKNKSDWFFYWVKSTIAKNYIQTRQAGSTQQYLTLEALRKFPVVFPKNPAEQWAIAKILSDLDAKIELNQQMNKTLEEIGKAIFKEWFVNFNFPNEEGKPYKSSGGPMEYNHELGKEIPKGWRVEKLSNCFDFLEGPGIRNWQYSKDGIKFINIRLLKENDIDTSSANFININDVELKYKHFLLEEKDYVLSTSGTLGRGAIVRKNHLPLLLNTSVIRFRPLKIKSYAFMYEYLKSDVFLNEQEILASGSVQNNFGPTHLKKMKLVLPPEKIIDMFDSIVKSLYDIYIRNLDEKDILISIRDLLLPKLMTGKIRVPYDDNRPSSKNKSNKVDI